jgi:cytochrome c5
VALFAVFIVPLSAWSEVIELKDGSKIEGKITAKSGTEVMVTTEGIEVRISGDEIKAINGLPFTCDYKAAFEQKCAGLSPADIEGHFKLALWCEEHKLKDDMNAELERVLAIDPNHEGANKKMGRLLFKGEWRTPDDLKKLGFVRKDGKWMTPDEVAEAEGKVTYKGNWVREEDRKRLDARQFSRYTDANTGFATHTVCELNREILAIGLLNMWNPTPQQLKQMWAVLNEAEADRQVFMQKRNEIAEEIESAWVALRNEALKGVVDSFNQDRAVEARAGGAEKAYKSLHKGMDFKLNTHTEKFMSILTPGQKSDFQGKYCNMCHSASVTKGAFGGRELRGTQAGVDFLNRVRSLSEDEFNAKKCDLSEEALKKFGKGPQTLLGKKAVRSGKRSEQDMDAEEKTVCGVLKRARLMGDSEWERKKFNVAAELEGRNQEERLRASASNAEREMGGLTSNVKMMGMVSSALFDGALRKAVGDKLGIPREQQVVKGKGELAAPEYKDGQTAFQAMCTMCHSTERINKATKDAVGWRETVEMMLRVSWGDMTHNINLITDYLVNRGQGKQAAK